MPNWCNNTLVLEHDDAEMIERARAGFEGGGLLQSLVPCPAELNNGELTTSYGDDTKQAVVDALKAQMREKYGYESWYDWCVANWGTKWDVGGDGYTANVLADGKTVTMAFDSAWSPPIEAYNKLVDLGFRVNAMYYEPGMAFAGVYDNGDDDCYNLSGMDSREARNRLPMDLDNEFAITEQMEEYEREEQDEVTTWYKDGVEDTGLEPHKVVVK